MPPLPPSSSSSLLFDEYYDAGNRAFLGELLSCTSDKKLAAFAPKWLADTRPFAQEMRVRYIDDGCDRPYHRTLVKQLFKHSERVGDDVLMGHFLVAFDRWAHRRLVEQVRHDWQTRERWVIQKLKRDTSVPLRWPDPKAEPQAKRHPRFSRATRLYLQRRAFRYFRRLGYREPSRYAKAMLATLPLYRDEHLKSSIQLLDSWGLMHVLYGESPILDRTTTGVRVKQDQALKDLVPAPMFPDLWGMDVEALLELALRANSRTVRAFVGSWLQRERAADLARLSPATIRGLIRSPHPDLQTLGVQLLERSDGLDKLPASEWIELLGLENEEALPILVAAVKKHVAPTRLTVEQCVTLAMSRYWVIAELGLAWLEARPVQGVKDVPSDILRRLKVLEAPCPPIRQRATAWLADLVRTQQAELPREVLRSFFDSEHHAVRAAGLALLPQTRFTRSTDVWTELSESPYDDVRAYLVHHLEAVAREIPSDHLRHLWATTLLAVHRGSRGKAVAARHVADRIVAQPAEAAALLPLLAVTLRSIRPSERRVALSTLMGAVLRRPSLGELVSRAIPELRMVDVRVAS